MAALWSATARWGAVETVIRLLAGGHGNGLPASKNGHSGKRSGTCRLSELRRPVFPISATEEMRPFATAFAESMQRTAGRNPPERTRFRRGHGMAVKPGTINIADFVAGIIGTTIEVGEIVDVEIPAGMTWSYSRSDDGVTLKFSDPPKLTIRKYFTFTGELDALDVSLHEIVAKVRIDGPVGWVVNEARMPIDWSGP